MRKLAVSTAVAVSLVLPTVSMAAGLSQNQLNVLGSLLTSFGVESNMVAAVQLALRDNPNSNRPDTAGAGHRSDAASSTPGSRGQNASSTPGNPWGVGAGMAPGQLAKQACITLSSNLGVGSTGGEVLKLQELLAMDPDSGYTASTTGYFGPITARALARYQEKHGIASSTSGGMVGPLTRAFLHRRCGVGLGGGGGSLGGGGGGELATTTVIGTITATSSTSITVQGVATTTLRVVMMNASTTIRVFASTTPPSETAGTAADLVVGAAVTIQGTVATDGSVTATRVVVQKPEEE
jgi:peptidoglycan hydrolase-like protein with peptidoglycan-binding domain